MSSCDRAGLPSVGYTGLTEPLPMPDLSEQLENSAIQELPKVVGCKAFSNLVVEEVIAHGDASTEIVRVAKDRAVDSYRYRVAWKNGSWQNPVWIHSRIRRATRFMPRIGSKAGTSKRKLTGQGTVSTSKRNWYSPFALHFMNSQPLYDLIGQYGLYAVFFLAMIEGDITLLLAGVLAHSGFFGDYSFLKALAAGTAGGVVSDHIAYFSGRGFRQSIRSRKFTVQLSHDSSD